MIIYLSPDANSQYSFNRPRHLESFIEQGQFTTIIHRLNSIPDESARSAVIPVQIQLFFITVLIISGWAVTLFRGRDDLTGTIQVACVIGGLIWAFILWNWTNQQKVIATEQLTNLVNTIDREFEQRASLVKSATPVPRICWSLVPHFSFCTMFSGPGRYIQIEVVFECCCSHLKSLTAPYPHVHQQQQQQQPLPSQVVTAVPISYPHQDLHPQQLPQVSSRSLASPSSTTSHGMPHLIWHRS